MFGFIKKKRIEAIQEDLKNNAKINEMLKELDEIPNKLVMDKKSEEIMMDLEDRARYISEADTKLVSDLENIYNKYASEWSKDVIVDPKDRLRMKNESREVNLLFGMLSHSILNSSDYISHYMRLSRNEYAKTENNYIYLDKIMTHEMYCEYSKNYHENFEMFLEVYKNYKIFRETTLAGLEGEASVNDELMKYKDMFQSLNNIRIEVDGKSIETDHLIFSDKGIFSLETKNYGQSGSYSLRITKDGRWSKVIGGKEEVIQSPTAQVLRHVDYTEKFINDMIKMKGLNIPHITIEPMIIIANDNVPIDNNSNIAVIRQSEIYPYLRNFQPKEKIINGDLDLIKGIFKEYNLPAKKYKEIDYVEKLKNIYFDMYVSGEQIRQIHRILKEFDIFLKKHGVPNFMKDQYLPRFDIGTKTNYVPD